MRPRGRRPTGATSGSVNDGIGDINLSGPRSASITRYASGKPDAVVVGKKEMPSPEPSRDTLRRNMLGRRLSAAASGSANACEASWAMELYSSQERPRARVVGYSILLNPLPVAPRHGPTETPAPSRSKGHHFAIGVKPGQQ